MECRFQEIFACGIRNPGLWNPEYGSRNLECLYDWDPEVSMTKNLKSSSRNAEPMEWNPESKIVSLLNLARTSWSHGPLHVSRGKETPR